MMRLCVAFLDAPVFGPGQVIRVEGHFVVRPDESLASLRLRIGREIGERPERVAVRIIEDQD